MKQQNNITKNFQDTAKAQRYIKLQNEGVPQIQATYMVFGTELGDEMLRLHQHEIIMEQPILN